MVEGTTLAVHRCRFVDFAPAAITALCFPPLSLPSVKGKKTAAASRRPLRFGTLAVGRANGNIELCEWTGLEHQVQAPQAWVVRKTLSGPYPSKVDSLAFVTRFPDQVAEDDVPTWANLRLFSAAGSSDLVEWDIEQGCIKRSISSQGGSIWCVSPNPSSTMLALGCEDGSVRLLSLEHDTLTHFRRLDRVKSRILSLAWGPPVPREAAKDRTDDSDTDDDDDDDDDDWSDSWLVAGCSDSCLRKWDVNNGRVLDRMATDKIRGERTLVWAVGVLGDGTIVSGDSMGMVKFWDPRTCTQMESFNGHAADVLCLTISPDGTAIYTSGVDQKITQFSLVKTSRSEPSTSLLSRSSYRWVQSCSRRMHSHDVRALAIWPPHAPVPPAHRRQFPIDIAPILASGGFDMSVVVTPAALPAATVTKVVNPLATSTSATFEDAYHRRLAYSSGTYNASAIHLARQARLLLCQRDASVTVWRILQRQSPLDMDETTAQNPDGGWERVLDMDLSFDTNITASAISDNGQWIAVSDWYETKLFRVSQEENGDLKPKRVRNFTSILQSHLPGHAPQTGASSLQFTPDSTKLVVATSTFSYVIIIDLGAGSGKPSPRVLRKFEQHRMRDVIVGNRVVKGKGRKLPNDENTPAENVEMVDAQERAEPAAPEDEEAGGNAPDDAPAPAPRNISIATITRMAISADGQWLATTDARCRTHVFNLDSVQHHALLPTVPAPVHALAFDAAGAGVLVLGLANNSIQVYDVEARAFPRWARALGEATPQRFSHLHDPILGVTFDPGAKERAEGARRGSRAPRNALFWGATWLCRVKLDEDAGPGGFDRKRRRDGSGRRQASGTALANASAPTLGDDAQAHPQKNFKVVTHYRPILFVDFIGRSELVVVERPLVDVLTGLPPAFFRPKYGKS